MQQMIDKKKATRDGFGKGLVEIAREDERIVALAADLAGSVRMDEFAREFPERFFQVGVAEQNLVTVASGLAAVGKVPFAGSFAAFSPGRNWEQIRTTICYNNQPVKIVGSHAGLSVGEDGATHQALEDIALMRVLPNMQVVVPCDAIEAKKATKALAATGKPVYLRLSRLKTETVTKEEDEFELGKGVVMREGKGLTIVVCGILVGEVMKMAEELDAEVLNFHTIKPFDEELLLESVKKTGKVVSVEEHQIAGGLGGLVAEVLGEKLPTKMMRIGVEDRFGESGKGWGLLEKYGLTAEKMVGRIRGFVGKSVN